MKLSTKLNLFITLSKLAIVVFFVLALPYLIDKIAFEYTNFYLEQQKSKVLKAIASDGVEFLLDGNESYGGYNFLHEDYIAIEPIDSGAVALDTIATDQRILDRDTVNYRLLSHTFKYGNQDYLLEIGKTTATINEYNKSLQLIALFVLLGLIGITLLIDLIYTHYLIKPLGGIIKSKLVNQKFPFARHQEPVKTTTSDFKYLDSSLMLLMEQINDAFEKEREFTANASHELMTPIGILQNKIENLMEHSDTSDLIQQRLSEMLRTLSRLKKIVNSLLLISRIENEQFTKLEVLPVKELVEEVMEEISHRLEEREIDFKLNLSQSFSFKQINRDLLFQLFYNLVNNAIRYNKSKGSILVEDSFEDGQYALNIIDSGIGIPEDDLPFIFDRFKKSNLSTTGGYGLGLAIVKSIASYHNIRINVTSKINEGTTFSVVFPADIIQKS